ncbi:hypothetical protein R1flu_011846 [Riccia fluitans]|uniref:Uncharacterized protein n=1 Tax=Riccia fluitans TaxID=41844 RepID=A0ABD1ZA40_9MARC
MKFGGWTDEVILDAGGRKFADSIHRGGFPGRSFGERSEQTSICLLVISDHARAYVVAVLTVTHGSEAELSRSG